MDISLQMGIQFTVVHLQMQKCKTKTHNKEIWGDKQCISILLIMLRQKGFHKERYVCVSNDDYHPPLKERNKKTTEAKISRIHFYEKAENMFLIVHLNVWTVAYSSTFSWKHSCTHLPTDSFALFFRCRW